VQFHVVVAIQGRQPDDVEQRARFVKSRQRPAVHGRVDLALGDLDLENLQRGCHLAQHARTQITHEAAFDAQRRHRHRTPPLKWRAACTTASRRTARERLI
jgi:hypothetical protein